MSKFLGKPECFSEDRLRNIVKEKELTSISNIEKALFALEYVGQLWESGVELVFKGGSAVQILLGDSWNRLSVDVDICTEFSKEQIEHHLNKIKGKFEGECFDFEPRNGLEGPHFQGYRVTSLPIIDGQRKFLLDIQGLKPEYKLTKTPMKSFFYDSDIKIPTPTGSSILGDKLSVIGPSTIGRKLNDSRNGVEYAKHFYDIYSLASKFSDLSQIRTTYRSCVEVQSVIRKTEFTEEACIKDAIDTCKVASLPFDDDLVKKMTSNDSLLGQYTILKNGVQRFQPFIVGPKFYNWENMREYASRTACLFGTIKKKSNNLENSGDESIEEMVETLESLPDEEKWFMDLDDLRLSPKVLQNWYQYYKAM
jgi:hypothetical protein